MFDDMDMTPDVGPEGNGPLPEETSNRTFLIAAGVLGGLILLTLVVIVAYGLWYVPRARSLRATQEYEILMRNTQVALGVTQTAEAALFTATPTPTLTPTPTPVPPTSTPAPTDTPVVGTGGGAGPTETPTLTSEQVALTATVSALLTQAASLSATFTPTPTPSTLPQGGFADDVGLPGMLALAAGLLLLIVVVRRMRSRLVG